MLDEDEADIEADIQRELDAFGNDCLQIEDLEYETPQFQGQTRYLVRVLFVTKQLKPLSNKSVLKKKNFFEAPVTQTELKNANGYVIALRHRTWAQARAHLK